MNTKAKPIKAIKVRGWKIEHARVDGPSIYYVLPAADYERMVEQMTRAVALKWAGRYAQDMEMALEAIGINRLSQK